MISYIFIFSIFSIFLYVPIFFIFRHRKAPGQARCFPVPVPGSRSTPASASVASWATASWVLPSKCSRRRVPLMSHVPASSCSGRLTCSCSVACVCVCVCVCVCGWVLCPLIKVTPRKKKGPLRHHHHPDSQRGVILLIKTKTQNTETQLVLHRFLVASLVACVFHLSILSPWTRFRGDGVCRCVLKSLKLTPVPSTRHCGLLFLCSLCACPLVHAARCAVGVKTKTLVHAETKKISLCHHHHPPSQVTL